MIQKGSVVAYTCAAGRYLLQGGVIDLETQVNLSEASRTEQLIENAEPEDFEIGKVVEVMDMAKKVGFTRLGIAVRVQ